MRPNGFSPLGAGLPRSRLGPILPLSGKGGATPLKEVEAFGANPGALRMFAYAPPGLPENAPLVVVLHGCGQTAADYVRGAGWITLADELGFAVLAPEQTRANNMNSCFNWFVPGDAAREEGEARSIRRMIAWMGTSHRLDPKRIFITGLSAGGAMAAAMLAAYPEIFAGGAIIAGLPYGSASNVPEALNSMRQAAPRPAQDWGEMVRGASAHPGPWPRVSIWHGDADTTVDVSNAEALIAQWHSLHGLAQRPASVENKAAHRRRAWKGKDGAFVLEAFILTGMGHGAPVGGPEGYGEAGPFFLDAGVSSTARIAAFWGLGTEQTATASKARAVQAEPVPAEDIETETVDTVERVETVWNAKPVRGVKATILAALRSAGLLKGKDWS